MARIYLPDGNDRTPKDPYLIMTSRQVIYLYNVHNAENRVGELNAEVKEWMCERAMKRNWDTCEWVGASEDVCLLGAHFKTAKKLKA